MYDLGQKHALVRRFRPSAFGLVCLAVLWSGCASQPDREPLSSPSESEPSVVPQVWSQEIRNDAGALAGLGEHGLDGDDSGDTIKGVLTVDAGCVFVDPIIGGDPMRVRHFERTGDPFTDEQQVRAFVRLPEGETVYNDDVRAIWVGAANHVTAGDYVVIQGEYGEDFSPERSLFEDACEAHTDIVAIELYPLRDTGRTGQTVQFAGQFPYHEALDYPDSDQIHGTLVIEEPCVFLDITDDTGEVVLAPGGEPLRAILRLPQAVTRYYPDNGQMWVDDVGPVTTGEPVVVSAEMTGTAAWTEFGDSCAAHTDMIATSVRLVGPKTWPQAEPLVGLWPYDPQKGYMDEGVYGFLEIDGPCVYLYGGGLGGERVYTADGELFRSLLRLPGGFTRHDPATGEIWVHDSGPMKTGDEVAIGGSGGVPIDERPLPGGCTAGDITVAKAMSPGRGPRLAVQEVTELVGLWPYDDDAVVVDDIVRGVLVIDEPCVFVDPASVQRSGGRLEPPDTERVFLRLPDLLLSYDPAPAQDTQGGASPTIRVLGPDGLTNGSAVKIAGDLVMGDPPVEQVYEGQCTAQAEMTVAAMGASSFEILDRAEPQSATSVFPPLGDGDGVVRWTVEIVEWFPHDPEAFTQGLEVADDTMYESTGLWGESSLRTVDPTTGEAITQVALSDDLFGEGLTVVGDEIVQLTWQSEIALVYDRFTLEQVREHRYEGEGWGLCLSDDVLIMSDGSNRLARRDSETFELLGTVTVTAPGYGGRLDYLNELECVEGLVIANVWQTDRLLVIDPESGRVLAAIDAGPLVDDVSQHSPASEIDVLNGVALDPDTATLWMTGKLWPRLYRVRVVEVQ